jgi:hypothetical protein
MLLSNWVIILSSIILSIVYLIGKIMDSKLASDLATLANNISGLTKAVTDFVSSNANPPLSATELPATLTALEAANTSITSVIGTLTPTTITIISAVGNVSGPLPPSNG